MNPRNALIVFLTIFFHAGTMPAFGAIRTVDDDGPADFASIQLAIADAGTVNGDEIVVQPGTYIGAIDFLGKAITLRSASGNPADTTINGNGADHVVKFANSEDPNSVLDGFTITGGNANGSDPDNNGGGIFIYWCSPTVTNCVLTGNTAYGGGGMYNYRSTVTITRCIFIGNNATLGGGMYNFNDLGAVNVTDCRFFDNFASSAGGGIWNINTGSSTTITQCIFSGNRSPYGGGIYNTTQSRPKITSCVFYGNTASTLGGGIYGTSASRSIVSNSIFWNNSVYDIYSGDSSSRSLVSFSNVEQGLAIGGTDGGGNIGSPPYFPGIDPLFRDPDGADNIVGTEDDEFHLLFGSPSVDTGDNFATNLPVTDLDGVLRILNGVTDMGPYELADCDGNGTIDGDSDLDGTPDECDVCPGFDDFLDADSDTVPDGCDLCFGDDATGDTDGDGICGNLDACPGFDDSIDDDNDGVIDGCDLCFGDNATLDTDGDGICEDLDICPYADDDGPDGDNDGIPDACDECSLIGDINCDGTVDLSDQAMLAMHWLETL